MRGRPEAFMSADTRSESCLLEIKVVHRSISEGSPKEPPHSLLRPIELNELAIIYVILRLTNSPLPLRDPIRLEAASPASPPSPSKPSA